MRTCPLLSRSPSHNPRSWSNRGRRSGVSLDGLMGLEGLVIRRWRRRCQRCHRHRTRRRAETAIGR